MWNKNICLTSRKSIMVILILLVSTLVLAGVLYVPEDIEEIKETPPVNNEETEMWVPTEEDIAYQDSMYTIIKNTQDDITDIKQDIVYILERLDYPDGSYDSIRYVKGGKIDKRRN
jgi:flagellar basal body-associated protein FliL